MRAIALSGLLCAAVILSIPDRPDTQAMELHEDYYLGFSQGTYYGLMLAGEDYHVAWCMKSELEYEATALGSGGEFQAGLNALLEECRQRNPENP